MAVNVFGAVVVNGITYEDNEMLALKGQSVGPYGIGWVYAGDQGFDESDISLSDDNGNNGCFFGRTGLKDFITYLEMHNL